MDRKVRRDRRSELRRSLHLSFAFVVAAAARRAVVGRPGRSSHRRGIPPADIDAYHRLLDGVVPVVLRLIPLRSTRVRCHVLPLHGSPPVKAYGGVGEDRRRSETISLL